MTLWLLLRPVEETNIHPVASLPPYGFWARELELGGPEASTAQFEISVVRANAEADARFHHYLTVAQSQNWPGMATPTHPAQLQYVIPTIAKRTR